MQKKSLDKNPIASYLAVKRVTNKLLKIAHDEVVTHYFERLPKLPEGERSIIPSLRHVLSKLLRKENAYWSCDVSPIAWKRYGFSSFEAVVSWFNDLAEAWKEGIRVTVSRKSHCLSVSFKIKE